MASSSGAHPRGILGLVALFGVSGLLHLLWPRPFVAIVPRALRRRRELVYATGVLELACAAGLSAPVTRRSAGLVSAGLLVAVFPANIQMAVNALRGHSRAAKILTMLRLPMQLPLIRTAFRAWSRP
jgi:uncharacterized membrane protein